MSMIMVLAPRMGLWQLVQYAKSHPQIQVYNSQVNAVMNKYAPQYRKRRRKPKNIINQIQQQPALYKIPEAYIQARGYRLCHGPPDYSFRNEIVCRRGWLCRG